MSEKWRVGSRVPLSVYKGDIPVCQCHNEEDAARIVSAMNAQRLIEILNTGLDRLKSIDQLRLRMHQMADDDEFWMHIARMIETDKQRDKDYGEARKYMEQEYGK